MSGDTPLTPEQLHDVIDALDRVMADAERLRRTITRQLAETRHEQRQELSTGTAADSPPRIRKQR